MRVQRSDDANWLSPSTRCHNLPPSSSSSLVSFSVFLLSLSGYFRLDIILISNIGEVHLYSYPVKDAGSWMPTLANSSDYYELEWLPSRQLYSIVYHCCEVASSRSVDSSQGHFSCLMMWCVHCSALLTEETHSDRISRAREHERVRLRERKRKGETIILLGLPHFGTTVNPWSWVYVYR